MKLGPRYPKVTLLQVMLADPWAAIPELPSYASVTSMTLGVTVWDLCDAGMIRAFLRSSFIYGSSRA